MQKRHKTSTEVAHFYAATWTHFTLRLTDIRVIQVLLGHAKLETTTIYTKVATKTIQSVTSPFDLLVRREAGPG